MGWAFLHECLQFELKFSLKYNNDIMITATVFE